MKQIEIKEGNTLGEKLAFKEANEITIKIKLFKD